jgi:hypothetical protein
MSDVYEIIEKLSREVCELHSDNQRLRARVEVLEEMLIDARHNGLIYWRPMTERGVVEQATMMARIDKVLNKDAKP